MASIFQGKLHQPVAFVLFFVSCKESSATENLVGCTPGIGSKMIYLEYSVFVLNNFIVLFIYIVSSVWFTVHCTFFFLSYAVATRGD